MVESSSGNWGGRSQVGGWGISGDLRWRPRPLHKSDFDFFKPSKRHSTTAQRHSLSISNYCVSGITWMMEPPIPCGQCVDTLRSENVKNANNGNRKDIFQQVFHGWKENKRAGCIPLKVETQTWLLVKTKLTLPIELKLKLLLPRSTWPIWPSPGGTSSKISWKPGKVPCLHFDHSK